MPKFNTKPTVGARLGRITSPVVSTHTVGAQTFEGHQGFGRTPQSELFLLGITNFVGENSFYEQAADRDTRFITLARQVAVEDIDWLTSFAHWLRLGGNMRTASLQLAAEAVKARLDGGLHGGNRQLIETVLQRPDEPGEFLAYWQSRYGNDFPKPVKRGVADAVLRMYNERAFIKYDSARTDWRFADVIAMVRPRPHGSWQDSLFEFILADRHGRAGEIPEALSMLAARQRLMATPVEQRRELLHDRSSVHLLFNDAGMTWEALSGWIQGPMDKVVWEAIIPEMGVMALIRNLRNFDQADISDEVAQLVISKITDEEQVKRSRTFPMRWLSAYNHAPSDRWKHALSVGAGHTLANVPSFAVNTDTLIMVDMSSSMNNTFTKDGTLKRWDAAALFGIALAKRNAGRCQVFAFSSAQHYWGDPPGVATRQFELRPGANVLNELQRWKTDGYFLGGGTETAESIKKHYTGQSRVVVITDEQAAENYLEVSQAAPANIPMYTWNLAGYQYGHTPSGGQNRHTFGGLTDAAFGTIPMLENLQAGRWPWETISD